MQFQQAFIDVPQVLNLKIPIVDKIQRTAGMRFIFRAAEVIDDTGQMPIRQSLRGEECVRLWVEQTAVVGRDVIGFLARVNEIKERGEVIPEGGRFQGIVVSAAMRQAVQARSNFLTVACERAVLRIEAVFAIGQQPAIFGVHNEQKAIEKDETLFAASREIRFGAETVWPEPKEALDAATQGFKDPRS
ncbi:MAG: hypothetical protein NTW86_05665 [Candidatus Sumerlaeota bacterium]|nr:hypothetical protein [Candidatus Sumerlaeota bacterium]